MSREKKRSREVESFFFLKKMVKESTNESDKRVKKEKSEGSESMSVVEKERANV